MGAIIALPVAFALIMATTNVYAARWFDDFNDGNALDGSPLAWSEHPALPGSYGSFGKKCPMNHLKSSATQHRKNSPRSSCGRFAMDCNFRRVSRLSSSFVLA